ncbi:DNA repair and transcription factor protein [Trypanosoma grayi]|uniref:DNA repair and transcription factor protein n=1 Tax=Trypanosoma grayi TaxID=71804 RepID=UPI0004F43BEC|nr:DNA repair and transcription factor protein [Trypanosoma grayi]KEG10863.1 DNA repair and transcription factor protein [Trypanosoma grayi]
MQKTILLLDGSEAVNSSEDYLPTRLLALRPQLNAFVHAYLDANPLASLGVVAMRDGVAYCLNPCTTNASEIIQALEVKYFLFGGSGAMSLENGLRLSLSELVDLRRIAKRARQEGVNGATNKEAREESTTRLRILLVSSSVTLIDPHDVFAVVKMVARLHVRVDVISFCGAVHVFEETAAATGGVLYTPMNYDHLTEVLRRLAAPGKVSGVGSEGMRSMIQVGFPVYVEQDGEGGGEGPRYIACPQCALMQTSIPSTCPLCKLLLCSAPLIHTTFIAHNELCAPSEKCEDSLERVKEKEGECASDGYCSLCCVRGMNGDGEGMWRCSFCRSERCGSCESYVRDCIGICPTCIASPL